MFLTLSQPLQTQISSSFSSKQLKCLIDNVYYEARGESSRGQILVAKTTLNRVQKSNFPDTICGVVYQPHQFSWTQTKKITEPNPKIWQIAANNAYKAFNYKFAATHFHSTQVQPEWSFKKQLLTREGNHIFYK